jgi:hypothetical protein
MASLLWLQAPPTCSHTLQPQLHTAVIIDNTPLLWMMAPQENESATSRYQQPTVAQPRNQCLQIPEISLQLRHCCFTFHQGVLPAPAFSAPCGTSSGPACSSNTRAAAAPAATRNDVDAAVAFELVLMQCRIFEAPANEQWLVITAALRCER